MQCAGVVARGLGASAEREWRALAVEVLFVRQPILFVWSVRSVWFVWLHETNQITRQTGLAPHVQTIEILACQPSFSAAC